MNRLTVLAAALFFVCLPARADERITDYSSEIRVAQTGALTVTEIITVNAEGYRIRHGIYRDFPTIVSKGGQHIRVGFDVLSVALDGRDEPYSVTSIEDGERVKIGDPNLVLTPGSHRFMLIYATDRQIGFFPGYDELYWNATGNFWLFPIDHAEALVTLPSGAHITQYSAYTGAAGSSAQSAQAEKISGSAIRFSTTAPLGAREGLTVAVGFAKGAVLPPSPAELRREFLRDNAASFIAVAGVLLMLIYFLVVWIEHGRRPPRGVIVPLFSPPRDFSPAGVRFVYRMAYDRKAYAASLVDMAVKGYLKIAEDHGVYTLTLTGKSEFESGLGPAETAVAGRLFAQENTIALQQSNHSVIAQSVSSLKFALAREFERVYFVTNSHWFAGGLAMLAVTALAVAVFADEPAAGAQLAWVAGASVATALFLHRSWEAWSGTLRGPGSPLLNGLRALGISALLVPVAIAWAFGLIKVHSAVPLAAALALSAGGAAAYAFYHLLKHPTLLGAKIVDEIEGFKMFLVTAEKDRLEGANPPNVTPEVFEKFLPYAIALDCETRWSEKFEAEAAAAGLSRNSSGNYYSPGWYSGSSFDRLGAPNLADSLGASMAAAAASAAVAPGSGGGGFSGGGGGGGGGGGW